MHNSRYLLSLLVLSAVIALSLPLSSQTRLQIDANEADGHFSIGTAGARVLQAGAAVEVNGAWLRSSDYPKHTVEKGTSAGELGQAEEWTLTYTGRADVPDLQIRLRAYQDKPFGDVQVVV